MINYSQIISVNYPNSEWAMSNEDYSTLQWFSETPKPTQEELDALALNTDQQLAKQKCKLKATEILSATDWTQANDCPLVNKADFTAYRAIVRAFAINPVANAVFPELPVEQWT